MGRDEHGPAALSDRCDLRHGARVAVLAVAFAGRMGWARRRRETLRLGATLHDVGKLTIARSVLAKPGPLTDRELEEVRRHPAVGGLLVYPIATLREALPCILYHHERWDGAGYPYERARTAIPVEARLLAVADAFDAMISDRPYRRALDATRALEELERGAGSQFDPVLAEAFVEAWCAGLLNGAAVHTLRESTKPRASIASAGSPRR